MVKKGKWCDPSCLVFAHHFSIALFTFFFLVCYIVPSERLKLDLAGFY